MKKWLPQPVSTSNAIFHSSKADGGLGLPEFTKSFPAQRINNLRALKNRSDQKLIDCFGLNDPLRQYFSLSGRLPKRGRKKREVIDE